MSLRADGRYRCDRSGRELVNGGVQEAASATRLVDNDDGIPTPVTFHFCYQDGCADKVLSRRNLADLISSEDAP